MLVKQLTADLSDKLGLLPTLSKFESEGSSRPVKDKKKQKDLGTKDVKLVNARRNSCRTKADYPFLLLDSDILEFVAREKKFDAHYLKVQAANVNDKNCSNFCMSQESPNLDLEESRRKANMRSTSSVLNN
jgi:hypothetical protein